MSRTTELEAQQALTVAEALLGPESPLQLIGLALRMPAPAAGPREIAKFFRRFAETIYPKGDALPELARAAALLLAAPDPDLDLSDRLEIADAIERVVREAQAGRESVEQVARALPRSRHLVPATEAEVAALVPLDEAVARAQGKPSIAELEARSLQAGFELLDGALGSEPKGVA